MTNCELRKRARENLGGNILHKTWLMAVLVVLIYSAINGAASSIATAGLFVIYGSLVYGYQSVFLNLSRGKKEIDLADSFSGFKNFSRTLVLGLLQLLYVFLWTLLFIIPGIIKAYSYSMAYYIMMDHPEYTPSQCLAESERIMRGNKSRLFLLGLSFIGWYIVGAFVFGVGTLWVQAYYAAAEAEFYSELVGHTRAEPEVAQIEAENDTDMPESI